MVTLSCFKYTPRAKERQHNKHPVQRWKIGVTAGLAYLPEVGIALRSWAIGFTEALAFEVVRFNIRVKAVNVSLVSREHITNATTRMSNG